MACGSCGANGPADMSSGSSDSEVDVNQVMESEVSKEAVSPSKVSDMQPSATEIAALCPIPCITNPAVTARPKEELPAYLERADVVSMTVFRSVGMVEVE